MNPITSRYMEDLTGQKFGKLTVISLDINRMEEIYSKGKKGSYWLCKCDCGSNKKQSVYQGELKSGKVVSCGCSRKYENRETKFEDLKGRIFGRLTVLSLNEAETLENRQNGQRIRFWNCSCECGNSVIVSGESLKGNKTKSCGCLRNETILLTAKNKALNGNSVGHYIENKYGKERFYDIWDIEANKNVDPYSINKGSNNYIYIKCDKDNTHPSYKVKALHYTISESRCPICQNSKGEMVIHDILTKNKINFTPQKEFDGLVGIHQGNLSYDFYIDSMNLLIEYQGIQHKEFTRGLHQSKQDFEKQQEHDRRKREYAKEHKIKLLEIWYYDFDNVEEILSKEVNLNNEIKLRPCI